MVGGLLEVETGIDGTFALTELQAGEWTVRALSPFNSLNVATQVLQVGESEVVTGVQLQLDVAAGALTGRVTGPDGNGIPGAAIYVCGDAQVSACASTTADAAGV